MKYLIIAGLVCAAAAGLYTVWPLQNAQKQSVVEAVSPQTWLKAESAKQKKRILAAKENSTINLAQEPVREVNPRTTIFPKKNQ